MDPIEIKLSAPSLTLGPNMLGMLQSLHCMMVHVVGEADVVALDELFAASSFGCKHYAYDPLYNLAYDPPRHISPWSECFSNFGMFESVGFYSGFEVKEFNGLSADDFWKLMVFELSQNRMLLSIGLHGIMEPVLVVGCHHDKLTRKLWVLPVGQDTPVEINMWGKQKAQGDHDIFNNWVVIARKASAPPWSSPVNQRLTLMRWLPEHANADKEFFHETSENYVTGSGAYTRMIRLLSDDWSDIPQSQYILLADHLVAYRTAMATGRAAMGKYLPRWASQLNEVSRLSDEKVQSMRPLWQEAAKSYLQVASIFETWIQRHQPTDIILPEGRKDAIAFLNQANQAESKAIELIAQSVVGVGM